MKRITTILLVSLLVTQLFAIPARKKPVKVQQPDGTSLTVTLHGDENFSYRTTTDGLIVQKNDEGYYVYCTTNVQGLRSLTSIIARNPEERAAEDIDQLALLSAQSTAFKALRKAQAQRTPIKKITRQTQELGQKGIVILAQYSDVKFTIPNFATEYNGMLNQAGYKNSYGQSGSAKDYFVENSKGLYTPSFTVLGPVTLPNTRAYYGANDKDGNDVRSAVQVVDAIAKANFTGVNLADYDSDKDGYVDLVYIVYAGEGEAYPTAPENAVWQHAWSLESAKYFKQISAIPTVQGKMFDYYACSSELMGRSMDGIGTFCHEYSHTLGLPDLYDTDYEENGQSYGVSSWSIMASGADMNDGYSPLGLTAYERDFLGWGKLIELTSPDTYTMESLWKTGNGYKITSSKKSTEYFILENRQKEGWDSYLPAEGMMIYHVDFDQTAWDNNEINAYASRPRFRVIPADNNDLTTLSGIAGDVYPGSKNNVNFSDQSIPAAKLWDNSYLGKPVTDIKMVNGIISFDFMGGKRIATPQHPFVGPQSETSAYFSWDGVAGASSYLVDVYTLKTTIGSPISESEPFKGGGIVSLNGWTTSATSGYTSSGNYGKASPSLKLDASNAHLTTPLYLSDITSFSFWLKWQGAISSKLKINGFINGEWTTLTELPTSTPSGTYTLSNVPKGTRQIALVYQKVAGNVAIDDVTLTTLGASVEPEYLPGYQGKEVFTNNLTISGITPMKTYYFVVKAKDATTESLASEVKSLTIDPLSIKEIDRNFSVLTPVGSRSIVIRSEQSVRTAVSVYNTLGQAVASVPLSEQTTVVTVPQKGIYFVEIGTYRTKVVVR